MRFAYFHRLNTLHLDKMQLDKGLVAWSYPAVGGSVHYCRRHQFSKRELLTELYCVSQEVLVTCPKTWEAERKMIVAA